MRIILFIPFILLGCQKPIGENYELNKSLHPNGIIDFYEFENENSKKVDSVVGVYHLSFPYFSSSIEIKEDYQFVYLNEGCMGESYTEGEWKKEGNKIILTSFPRFKDIPLYEIVERKEKSQTDLKKDFQIQSDKTEFTYEWTVTANEVKRNREIFIEKWELRIEDEKLIDLSKSEKEGGKVFRKI